MLKYNPHVLTVLSAGSSHISRNKFKSRWLKYRGKLLIVSLDKQGLLSLTSLCAACKTWNAHPSYWGSASLGPNFTGRCQNVDTVR